ncbi:hypothetical protein BVY04_02840 [bacterium M21]|nr:hypothetical protein BVY04_02840 [bacterium M21]
MIGGTELMIVCGVVVLLFGSAAIPKFAKSIGKAKKEFEKGVKEADSDDNDEEEKGDDKKSD